MPTHHSFETERLLLRPTTEADADFVYELLNSPKWLQFIGDRNVHSIEDAKQYINNKMQPQLERLGYSNYTVIRKSDQTKIGSCGLYDREGLEGIDIGFAFLSEYEGRGYAFEASNQIKKAAFQVFGISKIKAITSKDNLASQKLLRKLGLAFVEVFTLPNDAEELMLFELSA